MKTSQLPSNFDLANRAKLIVKQIAETMDRNSYMGHSYHSGRKNTAELVLSMYDMTESILEQIVSKTLPGPIPLGRKSCLLSCYYCGEDLGFVFDGNKIEVDTVCRYPGGIKSMNMELNCPSGKLVFANDLRRYFKVIGDWDINKQIGILKTFKSYEAVGMAYGFVGNSCPGVYRVDNQHLTISSSAPVSFWDAEAEVYVDYTEEEIATMSPAGEDVGSICTDLWWYSVVDYDDLVNRLDSKNVELFIKNNCDVVEVLPGVYKVDHFLKNHSRYDDHFHLKEQSEPWHYAKFTWVRIPDPIRDFQVEFNSMNYTIGQTWLEALTKYASLYGFDDDELPEYLTMQERVVKLMTFPLERIEASAACFYNHTLCTNGNGIDWHPNGWGSSGWINPETPDFVLPPLTKTYHWYPMSNNYCPLDLVALDKEKWEEKIHFNHSFLAAAWEVIHSILKFGVVVHEYRGISVDQETKILIGAAISHLRGLDTRYPGSMPEDYREFLLQYFDPKYDKAVCIFREDAMDSENES